VTEHRQALEISSWRSVIDLESKTEQRSQIFEGNSALILCIRSYLDSSEQQLRPTCRFVLLPEARHVRHDDIFGAAAVCKDLAGSEKSLFHFSTDDTLTVGA
jgi:hypothetical protein